MVAQQRAAVFDYTALQFSAADVQQLAGMSYALTLSDDSADQLMTSFGGWVTGIVLSLDQTSTNGHSSARQTPHRTRRARTLPMAHSPPRGRVKLIQADIPQVYAFFAEQIIAPLATDLQRFLEETSVLENSRRSAATRCAARNNSTLFLDQVKRHGLFVSSRAGWLSYHSLFRDFLRSRLARDPERRRTLLLRAGALYRDEDDIERALDCYLAVGVHDQAIALLRAVIPRFRRCSRQTTLLACFERLGQDRMLPTDLLLAQARVYGDLVLWERAYLALQLSRRSATPRRAGRPRSSTPA